MSKTEPKQLYLPQRDRSFWRSGEDWDLQYLAWGRRDFAEEHLPPCRHEGWTCLLIEEGMPEIIVQGQKVKLPRGRLMLIGPDCPFGWTRAEGNRCKFIMWMWRELEWVAGSGMRRDEFVGVAVARNRQEPFVKNHERCRREVVGADEWTGRYLEASRAEFEIEILRALRGGRESAPEEKFVQAVAWVRGHLESRKPIARLCDYLSLSQSSLHRLFKEASGMSPAAFVHRERMEAARGWLREGGYQVKEVALRLGYSQANDFSRAYRLYFEKSPREEMGRNEK